jgi:hypothetical protein
MGDKGNNLKFLIIIILVILVGASFTVPAFPIEVEEEYQELEPYDVQVPYNVTESYEVIVPVTVEKPVIKERTIYEINTLFSRSNKQYAAKGIYHGSFTLNENKKITINWTTDKPVTLFAITSDQYFNIVYSGLSALITKSIVSIIASIGSLLDLMEYSRTLSVSDLIKIDLEAGTYHIIVFVTDPPTILSCDLTYTSEAQESYIDYVEDTEYKTETRYRTVTKYKTGTEYRLVTKTKQVIEYVTLWEKIISP